MGKNVNKIILSFSITDDGKFAIKGNDVDAFNEFKKANPGKDGELILEIDSGPRAKQHRKYRGDILPAIFEICGGLSKEHFHRFVLKPMFKTLRVTELSEIPSRYLNCHRSGDFYHRQRTINGVTEEWIEYVPSTAAFTVDEMAEYIENCKRLLNGLQSAGSLEEIQELMGSYGRN